MKEQFSVKRTYYFVTLEQGDWTVTRDELHIGETTPQSVAEATAALNYPNAVIERAEKSAPGQYTILGVDANGAGFAVVVQLA